MYKHPLSVRNLRKVYPRFSPFAEEGISFDLSEGEILGLLGPNGAGKTTTIHMLLGTLKPTSGSITYFGKDFARHRSEVLKRVSFASTYVSLPWNITVERNLKVFGLLQGIPPKEIRPRMYALLEQFGIYSKRNMQVSSLSAGQITRLMIIKAFFAYPKIVLLDEPTASLDPEIADDVCKFVFEMRNKQGTSILYTSHNMHEVATVCDRVLVLQKGRIIANDSPRVLASGIGTSKLQFCVKESELARALQIFDRLKLSYKREQRFLEFNMVDEEIPSFLNMLSEARVPYHNMQIMAPTLHDYFLKIAGRR